MSEQDRNDYLDKYNSPSAIAHATMTYAITMGIFPDLVDAGLKTTSSVLKHVDSSETSTYGDDLEKALSMDTQGDLSTKIPVVGYANKAGKAMSHLVADGDVAGAINAAPLGGLWYLAPALTAVSKNIRSNEQQQ